MLSILSIRFGLSAFRDWIADGIKLSILSIRFGLRKDQKPDNKPMIILTFNSID